PLRLWGWRLDKIPYWNALLFFIGSICFCFASAAAYANLPSVSDKLFAAYVGWPSFTGSVCFTIGSYLQVLEVLNAPAAPEQLMQKHPDAPKPRWQWIGWQPHRLDFVIAMIQQASTVGALIFNVNTLMGSGAFSWGPRGLYWAVWFPDIMASCCFVAAGYLGLVEYIHAWWAWRPSDPIWWLNMSNFAGGVGFLLNALFGIAWLDPSLAYERGTVFLWLLLGSICFQVR
ncbi:unnamed protein product, partial [Phaeothamnion confervicola]